MAVEVVCWYCFSSSSPPSAPEVSDSGRSRKKVTWAAEDSLTTVHYFEMDESERGKGEEEVEEKELVLVTIFFFYNCSEFQELTEFLGRSPAGEVDGEGGSECREDV